MTTMVPASGLRLAELATEHDRLAVTVRQLAEACAALDAGRTHVDAAPVIAALELELFRHFAAEEAEDHFGAIVRQRPALSHRVSELKVEHTRMLRTVSELVTLAADSKRRRELGSAGTRFVAELRNHEDKENALLQEFVLRDEGASQD